MMAEDPESRTATMAALAEQLQRLSRAEAGDLAQRLEARWRVNARPFRSDIPVIGDPPPPGYEIDSSRFDLIVADAGSNRLSLIKTVRSIMGIGVIEAKALIETLPLRVADGLNADDARRMKLRLEECGAVVILESTGAR